ncbi:MAG TPA: DNA polymerase II [Ignavibacteriales bacterium]|nr:DNA polymerase II [Ignavibacteriales bacterium]
MADQAKVFILTGEHQDLKTGNTLRYWGISDDGMPVEFIIDSVRPVFFTNRENTSLSLPIQYTRKEVKLKSFDFRDVDALYFRTQKDLRSAAEILRSLGITTYESDVDPVRRFLMERFIHVQLTLTGECVNLGHSLRFINPKVEPCEFDPKFKVASIDIETGIKDGTLYSIAVHLSGRNSEEEKIVFMLADDALDDGQLKLFRTQKDLLQSFLNWFKWADPDLIIGWHVIGFDLMFLENKARELHIPFDISRGGGRTSLVQRKSGGYFAYIPGRVVLDGPPALRSAFYSFEDFRLETVSQELLGRGKTITPDEDKIGEIEKFFSQDKHKLAEYNLQDAVLVSEIFAKTGLIDLCVKRSQISGLFMDQLSKMTQAFDNFYLPRLHRAGFVAPESDMTRTTENLAGGYVIDPRPGIYDNVVVMDYKSLYPSIIETFKIDPLSKITSEEDTILTPGGYKFSRTRHILPEYIGSLMHKRAGAKRSKNKHLAQAIKILMNSFYGVMGAYGCRFFDPYLPNSITSTGQWILLESKRFLEEKGYEIVYGDTDSLFIKLKKGESEKAALLGEELAREMNLYWKERLLKEFSLESFLEIEFEKHYSRFILTTARGGGGEAGAKKRYAGLIETGGRRHLEFTGMEIVRSDWTRLAKEFQQELYSRIFNSEDADGWIRSFVEEVTRGLHDEKLVYRKRLRKDVDLYTKNTPPHVKAARLTNTSSGIIKYVMTKRGPVPVELGQRDFDYQHYIDKQIKPIADSVLGLLGRSFDELFKPTQLNFFS